MSSSFKNVPGTRRKKKSRKKQQGYVPFVQGTMKNKKHKKKASVTFMWTQKKCKDLGEILNTLAKNKRMNC